MPSGYANLNIRHPHIFGSELPKTAHWTFDEASGSVLDYSGNGLTGTLAGSAARSTLTPPLPQNSNVGSVFIGTGSNSVSISSAQVLGFGPDKAGMTISVWLKCSNVTSSEQEILSFAPWGTNNHWQVALTTSKTVRFLTYYGYTGGESLVATSTAIDDGNWHHIGISVNRSTGFTEIFIDGVSKGSATLTRLPTTPFVGFDDTSTLIGNDGTSATAYNGYIDDFRIYSSVLSSNQIAALAAGAYSLGRSGTTVISPIYGTFRGSKQVALVASGTTTPPTVNGRSSLSKTVVLRSTAIASVSISTGRSNLSKSVNLSSSGQSSVPIYSGRSVLSKSVNFNETSNYIQYHTGYSRLSKQVVLVGVGSRIYYGADLAKALQLRAIGSSSPPIYTGRANLNKSVSGRFIASSSPPVFNGRARLSKTKSIVASGNASQLQSASLNLFIEGVRHESSGSLDLFIEGSSVPQTNSMAVGSIPLYVDGANLINAGLNLFIEGESVLRTLESSLNLYLSADYPVVSGHLDLYLMADIPSITASIPLFIKGDGLNVGYYYKRGDLNLFIEGSGTDLPAEIFNSLDLFIKGYQPNLYNVSNNLLLFLKTVDGNSLENNLDLFIEGANPNVISASLDLVIPHTMMTANLPLFIRGI